MKKMRPEPAIRDLGKKSTIYVRGAAGRISAPAHHHRADNTPVISLIEQAASPFQSPTLLESLKAASLSRSDRIEELLGPLATVLGGGPALGEELSTDAYICLPAGSSPNADLRWRIELHHLEEGAKPLGLDIVGDVVMGRGSEADLNLDPYGAYKYAVSRRHALLRPTYNHLYLLDMSSTNGTLYNTVPLGRCAIHPLADGDVITLGMLNFVLKIIDSPKGDS